MIERRVRRLQWRDEVRGSGGRQRWATAVTYGTVDSYGTIWRPKVFDAFLRRAMPTILYGHNDRDITNVLGRGIDHREHNGGVDVLVEFANPKTVPSAAAAMEFVGSGALTDVSVGFERIRWVEGSDVERGEALLGAREAMIEAEMHELSLVVSGAVPGAGFRSVISSNTPPPDVDLAAWEYAQQRHDYHRRHPLPARRHGRPARPSAPTTTSIDRRLDAALDDLLRGPR